MTISWTAIQALHEPDLERHWVRCRDELGLDCPLDVFEELFFEHHGDAEFGTLYRAVDWSAVAWTETELSGVLLRRVGVDRGYQYAVDEARARTLEEGLSDARDAVVEHWAQSVDLVAAADSGDGRGDRAVASSTSCWWGSRGSAICSGCSIGRRCPR